MLVAVSTKVPNVRPVRVPVLNRLPALHSVPDRRGVVETVGVASPPGPPLTRAVMKNEYVRPLLKPVIT